MTNRLLEGSTKLSSIQERSGGQRSGVIQVWVTDEHTRFERVGELEWRAQHIDTEPSIVVDPNQKFQEVLGFGSALTDAACYLISELPAAARNTSPADGVQRIDSLRDRGSERGLFTGHGVGIAWSGDRGGLWSTPGR